jgi:hypothetical protein
MSISVSTTTATASRVAALAAATVGIVLTTTPVSSGAGASGPPGRLVIIQAVPQDSIDVSIDGRMVRQQAAVGDVLGPLPVSPGQHEVGFRSSSGDVRVRSSVMVAPGSSHDIVVHLPAAVDGAPVVNSYRTPQSPIAPGKARVLIAHTATVAPADVRVDGKVVFRDIANGEYATADVPAGGHSVALLPTGLTKNPILGPLHVDLKAGTVTSVYAVGNPRDGSMNVIAHTATLSSNGAVVPESIDTGRVGLAAGVKVHPFDVRSPSDAVAGERSWDDEVTSVALVGAAAGALGVVVFLGRRRRAASRRW